MIKTLLKGCYGKKRYRDENMAVHIQKKAWKVRRVKLRIYYCDNCFGWHVTKQIGEDNG